MHNILSKFLRQMKTEISYKSIKVKNDYQKSKVDAKIRVYDNLTYMVISL